MIFNIIILQIEWMNEWMMHFYSAFIVYCCTPKALYNHVGGSLLNHHQCAASTWMIFCWMKLPLKILFWLIWSAINHTTTLRSISHHSSQLFWCSPGLLSGFGASHWNCSCRRFDKDVQSDTNINVHVINTHYKYANNLECSLYFSFALHIYSRWESVMSRSVQ